MVSRSFVLFGVLVLFAMVNIISADEEAEVADDSKANVADVATGEDADIANKAADDTAADEGADLKEKLTDGIAEDRKINWGKIGKKIAGVLGGAAATGAVNCATGGCNGQ